MVKKRGIVICDFGSQYTLLIARKLRELGFYAELVNGTEQSVPDHIEPEGIILSGGPDGVNDQGARMIPAWVSDSGLPVLGICYGMQLLVSSEGGELHSGRKKEFGKASIRFNKDAQNTPAGNLFKGQAPESQMVVWMSHGDHVDKLPESLVPLAYSDEGIIAAIAHREKPWMGFQFHPEVHHSPMGGELLSLFAEGLCRCVRNWNPTTMVDEISKRLQSEISSDERVLLAVSGGVDSSVAALLLTKALGPERVDCVFVDHGMLRKNEGRDVAKMLRSLGLNLEVLHREEAFLSALQGLSDPEDKRKTIGQLFIQCFEEHASGKDYTHLGQGTLYPDVIESAGHGSGSHVIKSHHNVGGLPERLALKLIEPFRYLFKDEVRVIGRELGLPDEMTRRHPFPGPGLAVRIPGEVSKEKVAILQQADEIYINSLREAGYYEKIWQAATILLPVKSVGVMGDQRTWQWACVLRAVTGVDAMTAEASDLPVEFLSTVARKIVQQVDGINRVLYDVTSKPPATIEWE